jgi:hypothetical protein
MYVHLESLNKKRLNLFWLNFSKDRSLSRAGTVGKGELHSAVLKIVWRIQKLWCQTGKNILLQFKG